ncbi:MAG TPA: molybdopterin-guanine dinucleotide biosynthesis protein B, partial [bacterium]|nr:molybdopterin-guanine dinucleotide biosynthesis protein B [bacterium]
MTQPVPVLGISGYSGSGKTSLIVHLVRQLTAQGLLVGVLKHSHHPLEGPSERDTTLFTEAGATAVLGVNDDGAALVRRTPWLIDPLAGLPPDLDLILVEGFKAAPIPKLWIDHRRPPPPEAEAWVIPTRSAMAPEEYTSRVVEWLAQRWALRPLRLGLLVGGGSTRMGRPKALMVIDGQPLALKLGHELG